MILIICEKPDQAKKFVEVFTKYTNTNFSREKGYYSNGTIQITYAIGHLVELANPELYDINLKKWELNTLPIIPTDFKLVASNGKTEQLKTIRTLLSNSDIIYNAADAAREGELIFRYIINLLNVNIKNKVFKRIWAVDQTYDTIINAYKEAKDQKEYDLLYHSAKARNESDWLIGINASRALTLASKSNTTLSLGRIQTAVLRLIVDRYNKNKDFTSNYFYVPYINVNDVPFEFNYNTQFDNLEDTQNFLNSFNEIVKTNFTKKEILKTQPKLFSLIDLQITLNKDFQYNAAKSLKLAQELYENMMISYPRTDSNYLTNALKDNAKKSLNNYAKLNNIGLNEFVNEEEYNNHFIFNDNKTSDHYAIIPLITSKEKIDKLSKECKNVFNTIVKRYLQCFMQKAIIEEIEIFLYVNKTKDETEENYFYKKLNRIILPGYLKLDEKYSENKFEEKFYNFSSNCNIKNKSFKKEQTKPLALFTEATLLSAMKNPNGYEKIDTNKDFVKSLGTPATHHNFLPILLLRNYVYFDKKYILPYSLGISIIDNLKDTKLNSIELTADIEFYLNEIRTGNITYENYMKSIIKYTKDITEQIKDKAKNVTEHVIDSKNNYSCPMCKTGFIYLAKNKKNYYCSNYKLQENLCNFILYTNIGNKKITEKNISDILSKKETSIMQFENKNGKKYKAKIILNKEFKTEIVFEN